MPIRTRPIASVKADVSLVGDSAPVLRALLKALPRHNMKRKSRKAEMEERQAKLRKRLAKLVPQLAILDAIRAELPEDGIFVDEVTQIGFAARLAMPVYKPRTFISPGYQDNLGWGFATALGVQDARRDVPVLSISGDGGFLYTANETGLRGAPQDSAGHRGVQQQRLRQCEADPAGMVWRPHHRERPAPIRIS